MIRVTELGYLGIGVKDGKAWKEFAGEVVGMEVVDEGERDRFYLRMDEWHHRLVVHTSGEDDLLYMGLRVAGPEELEAMEAQLASLGIAHRRGSQAEAQERRVLGLLKLEDPSGIPLELFHGPQVQAALPFYPGRRMHGRFLTGSGGIGHVIIDAEDPRRSYEFYTRALGMRGSVEYRLPVAPGIVAEPVFLHCNDRDHSIAFGVGPMERKINHLMIEVTTLDDVGLTHETVRARNIPVAIGLGKHSNDQAYTFYFANPSGWLWELGWGARKATMQSEYYVGDIFGHRTEAKGFGMDIDLEAKK